MDRNGQASDQPTPASLTPQPSPIFNGPATVDACQREYAAAEDIRERLDEQIRNGH